MGASKAHSNKKSGDVHDGPRVGTWISLGVVAAVILISYLTLYGLFMARV